MNKSVLTISANLKNDSNSAQLAVKFVREAGETSRNLEKINLAGQNPNCL